MAPTCKVTLPSEYIEPTATSDQDPGEVPRVKPRVIALDVRKHSCKEVEETISAEEAIREAGRCLRCDLEFTAACAEQAAQPSAVGGKR